MLRIIGAGGDELFLPFDNRYLRGAPVFGADDTRRVPVFDIRISASRANPFSRVSQNELACEFFRLGLFDPARAQEALCCLSMMDFEGRDEMTRRIRENGQLAAAASIPAFVPASTRNLSADVRARVQSAQGSNA